MSESVYIRAENASITFPVFNASNRSLRTQFLSSALGGRIGTKKNGQVQISAISDVSFTCVEGERIGLLGHNGSGKSTLLRAIAGVYEPTSGSMDVSGGVGSLIDISLGINGDATGQENVLIRGQMLGMTKAKIREKYEEIVEFSELGEFMDVPVRTYSSGMHLRLAFAVSTLIRPEILVMDEWLSVGDESFKRKAQARLAEVVDSSKILIIATHSRELLEKTCTRALWLEHGQIKMDGPAKEVAQAYFG